MAIDAAIGFFADASDVEPGTHLCDLLEDPNVRIARKGHPLFHHRRLPGRSGPTTIRRSSGSAS